VCNLLRNHYDRHKDARYYSEGGNAGYYGGYDGYDAEASWTSAEDRNHGRDHCSGDPEDE